MNFEVTILGSGAALPTALRKPTAQYVVCNNRHMLIDCGEGTQSQMRKFGIRLQQITHIFISHLHGDHFFGLVGLLSTMHLLGRTKGLFIYGPAALEGLIRPQLEVGGNRLEFDLRFIQTDDVNPQLLFEDKLIEVHSFPLKHRIPTTGFRIQEKQKERSLIGEVYRSSGLSLQAIPFFRKGLDYVDELGQIHYVDDYTYPPKKSRSYAYCSDTLYWERILPHIEGVTCLYHEATFLDDMKERAKATFHTTAKQAAIIAQKASPDRLIIGHLSARYNDDQAHLEEAKQYFDRVEVAHDGMRFSL